MQKINQTSETDFWVFNQLGSKETPFFINNITHKRSDWKYGK